MHADMTWKKDLRDESEPTGGQEKARGGGWVEYAQCTNI